MISLSLVLLSVVGTVTADQSQQLQVVSKLADGKAKEIFIGILEGMESDIGNLTECLRDNEQGAQDFEQFVHLLEDGIATRNRTEISVSFTYLALGLRYFVKSVSACGYEKVAEDLVELITELQVPGGWIRIIEKEGTKIFVHLHDVTLDLQSAITDYNNQNWNAFGQDIGRVLGYLL